jgi:GTP-binding protein HflX
VLLSDTVGFIRKLPHELVDAFKATLEELTYADLLLHVIDISNPDWEAQARVVEDLIDRLGASRTPCLRVYNKCDKFFGRLPGGEAEICVSARTGRGTKPLRSAIGRKLGNDLTRMRLSVPYGEAAILDRLRREANILDLDYREDGVAVTAVVRPDLRARVMAYEVNDDV